jgi:hypothetical protein
MSFDLEDVGEFINENPQVPLAAGLMAGQAMRRNAQQAQRTANAIKQGLEEIKRQAEQARKHDENRAQKLADDKETIFKIGSALDLIAAEQPSAAAYVRLELQAQKLATRNISTASFANFDDKAFLQSVEIKFAHERDRLVAGLSHDSTTALSQLKSWFSLLEQLNSLELCCNGMRSTNKQVAAATKLVETHQLTKSTFSLAMDRPKFRLMFSITTVFVLIFLISLWKAMSLHPTFDRAGQYTNGINSAAPIICVITTIGLFIMLIVSSIIYTNFTAELRREQKCATDLLATCRSQVAALVSRRDAIASDIHNLDGIDQTTLEYAASLDFPSREASQFMRQSADYCEQLCAELAVDRSALKELWGS